MRQYEAAGVYAGEILAAIRHDMTINRIPWDLADLSELHACCDPREYFRDAIPFISPMCTCKMNKQIRSFYDPFTMISVHVQDCAVNTEEYADAVDVWHRLVSVVEDEVDRELAQDFSRLMTCACGQPLVRDGKQLRCSCGSTVHPRCSYLGFSATYACPAGHSWVLVLGAMVPAARVLQVRQA